MNLKKFEIKTEHVPQGNQFIFYTKARCGKDALANLLTHSGDFIELLGCNESNNMRIVVKHVRARD